MKFFLPLFFTSCFFYSTAQNPDFEKWNEKKYETANSAKGAAYLREEEKNVIYYLNLARMDGQLFSETYLKAYLDSTHQSDKWTRSLQKDLKKSKSLEPLQPAQDLFEAAKLHAEDMGSTGKVGHNTSLGKNPKKRFKELQKIYNPVGENCDYGNDKALDIVMSLLIDKNVSSLGHRKNILSKNFSLIGVSIQPHKKFEYNCVMSFGGKKQ